MAALREIFASFGVEFDKQGNLARGNRAVDQTKRNVGGLGPVVEKATKGFQALGLAIGGAAAVASLTRFVTETIRIGDELDKTSQQLGLTTQELQSFRLAADLSGAGAERMNVALAQLSQRLVMANQQGGEQAQLFRRIGVAYRDEEGGVRRVSDVMADIADVMQRTENPTERVGIAMRVFGENGRFLLPMLQGGSEGLAQMRAELEELGGGASEGMISSSVALSDSLTRFRVVLMAVRSTLAVWILPVINDATNRLRGFMAAMNSTGQTSKILKAMMVSLGAIGVAAAIKFAVAWGAALLPIALVAAVAAILYLAIEDVVTAFQGGRSVTEEFGNSLGYLFGVADFGTGALEGLRMISRMVADSMHEGATAGGAFVGVLLEVIGISGRAVGTLNTLSQVARGLLNTMLLLNPLTAGLGVAGFAEQARGAAGGVSKNAQTAESERRARLDAISGSVARRRRERTEGLAAQGITPQQAQFQAMTRNPLAYQDSGLSQYFAQRNAPPATAVGRAAGAVVSSTTVDAPITAPITINGATDTEGVRRVVGDELSRLARRIQNVTGTPAGTSGT